MSPGADGALAFCGLESQAFEARHDRPIVGCQYVFREEHDAVAVVPSLHAFGFEFGGPLDFLLDQREVFGFSACQESQSVEGSGDRILAARLWVGGLGHAIGEGLATEFEESLGFRAIVGCRWAIGPEDFAGELDFDRLSSPPAGQMEFPGALLWANSVRGSEEKGLPPAPRMTSPGRKIPSALEFGWTWVTRIWRASLVTSLSEWIQPRMPVGPRFQSFLESSGIVSPRVKSGPDSVDFWSWAAS